LSSGSGERAKRHLWITLGRTAITTWDKSVLFSLQITPATTNFTYTIYKSTGYIAILMQTFRATVLLQSDVTCAQLVKKARSHGPLRIVQCNISACPGCRCGLRRPGPPPPREG